MWRLTLGFQCGGGPRPRLGERWSPLLSGCSISPIMAGLGPAIHVDARHKAGHDRKGNGGSIG
jgi:hypothetical protein